MLIALLVAPLNTQGDNTLLLFLGRFHPLVLHVPIGALIALFVVEFVQCIRAKLNLDKACEILLWVCVLSSIPAVLAGYLLASSGGYSESLLDRHMRLGWATAFLCTWLLALRYWAKTKPKFLWTYRALLCVNMILLSLAGHYGGSLTHGSDYLTKYMPIELKNLLGVDMSEAEKMLAEINEQEAIMHAAKESGKPVPVAAVASAEEFAAKESGKPVPVAAVASAEEFAAKESGKPVPVAAVASAEEFAAKESGKPVPVVAVASAEEFAAKKVFAQHVRPIMDQYCYSCHGPDKQKGMIRLDDLDWDMINGPHAESWHTALDQINAGEMPPKGKAQPSNEERRLVVDWITENLEKAAITKRGQPLNMMRRLTRQQYTNTLNELLSLNLNFGEMLPDDAKSEMGFTNNAETLQTSPLHFDYFQKIAREALDHAIVTGEKPEVKRYKVEFGKDIGVGELSGKFGGYQAQPISPSDLKVLVHNKDGSTVVEKNIGVDLRGSTKDRYQMAEQGMTLYSALPHKEVAPKSWQGPSPNMKMLIKDVYPGSEPFMLRVEASKGKHFSTLQEGFISLREKKRAVYSKDKTIVLNSKDFGGFINMEMKPHGWLAPVDITRLSTASLKIEIPETGLYHIDFEHPYVEQNAMPSYRIEFSSNIVKEERMQMDPALANKKAIIHPMSLVFLKKKKYTLRLGGQFFVGFRRIALTPLSKDTSEYKALLNEQEANAEEFKDSVPALRAFAGTRTDDGMDYQNFDSVRKVDTAKGQSAIYEFRGHFHNLPVPKQGASSSGDWSNTMLVGIWNDYLVDDEKIAGPPVLIHSMELEAPYYEQWPPKSHTDIFFESPNKSNESLYAREVIRRFMVRAFRRDVSEREVNFYHDFWKKHRIEFDNFQDSVKEVFVGILCSPNFLYILQPQEDEVLQSTGESLLASQLSYFLWNQPPDAHLIELAANGTLSQSLNSEIDRMIGDPKILNMIKAFAYEWLRIDRLDQINTDTDTYPDFNRFTKESMANETYHFIKQVLQEDLSIMHLIDSDFTMLNKYLADFYGIEGVEGSDFRKVQLPSDSLRGGLLTQGAFLTGHSDGIQSHPIKRAVWLKEKILGEKPPPAPPNVPELDPDTPGFEKLSLKEQLELHRNKASCVDCHLKIDPYGVVFENFNATGSFIELIKNKPVDAATKLPDGTEVEGVEGIKQYILESRTDHPRRLWSSICLLTRLAAT